MSEREFETLTVSELDVYFRMIERLEAEQMLRDFIVSDYPNMKQDGRTRIHRKTYNTAFPPTKDTKFLTTEEVFRALA